MIMSKEVQVHKVPLEDYPTNMLAKYLLRSKFKHSLDLIKFDEKGFKIWREQQGS